MVTGSFKNLHSICFVMLSYKLSSRVPQTLQILPRQPTFGGDNVEGEHSEVSTVDLDRQV